MARSTPFSASASASSSAAPGSSTSPRAISRCWAACSRPCWRAPACPSGSPPSSRSPPAPPIAAFYSWPSVRPARDHRAIDADHHRLLDLHPRRGDDRLERRPASRCRPSPAARRSTSTGVCVLPQELWLIGSLVAITPLAGWFFRARSWGWRCGPARRTRSAPASSASTIAGSAWSPSSIAGLLGGLGGAVWAPISYAQVDIGLGVGAEGLHRRDPRRHPEHLRADPRRPPARRSPKGSAPATSRRPIRTRSRSACCCSC